ncbi:hypothetical protein H0H93_008667 [Arthromyces matolae]|nr:hypothetical protein H0H93_008667 [Arthromyces matolae]
MWCLRPEPDTCYSFTKARNGGDVAQGIGFPEKMPTVAPLPSDLDRWDKATLSKVAMDISARYNTLVKEIRDDKNEINRAIMYAQGRLHRPKHGNLRDPVVPELPQPDAPKQELVEMIEDGHKKLGCEVYARNRFLAKLSKVPHPRHILNPGPDKNVYMDYWKNSKIQLPQKDLDPKPLPSKHSGGGNTANVLPSTRKRPADAVDTGGPNTKRLITPYDITEEEALADMLEETAAALKACQDDVHSPWHPHHLYKGVTHDPDVPSITSPTPPARCQSNGSIPVDPRSGAWQSPSDSEDQNKHLNSYFDFDKWEERNCL